MKYTWSTSPYSVVAWEDDKAPKYGAYDTATAVWDSMMKQMVSLVASAGAEIDRLEDALQASREEAGNRAANLHRAYIARQAYFNDLERRSK